MKHLPLILVILSVTSCSKIYDFNEPGNLVPETVVENLELPSLKINGTVLHAEAFGNPSNPVLVILHGGPGADYRSLMAYKDLAYDGYYVVFFDQRGSGLSERLDKSYITLDNYLEDLKQVIDHYTLSDTQSVSFLGHSWGAMYATMFINNYPHRIKKAIYVEPGGFTSEEINEFFEKTFDPELFSEWMNDMSWVDNIYSSSNPQLKTKL